MLNILKRNKLMKCMDRRCGFYWLDGKTILKGVCPKCGGNKVAIAAKV